LNPDFERLVGGDDLDDETRRRLRRMHEMLVAAGPPEELPAAIGGPPATPELNGGAKVIPLEPARRRRPIAIIGIAAAVAAACFGGGYVLANQVDSSSTAIHTLRVVPMHPKQGEQNSEASLRVGSADGNGNWPIQLTVNGLRPLADDSRYYLIVWRNGKPVAVCGTFEVGSSGPTTVTFNVAYKIKPNTKWVVTRMVPGAKYPGHVVMTTA
jgi:hypothetical protein